MTLLFYLNSPLSTWVYYTCLIRYRSRFNCFDLSTICRSNSSFTSKLVLLSVGPINIWRRFAWALSFTESLLLSWSDITSCPISFFSLAISSEFAFRSASEISNIAFRWPSKKKYFRFIQQLKENMILLVNRLKTQKSQYARWCTIFCLKIPLQDATYFSTSSE